MPDVVVLRKYLSCFQRAAAGWSRISSLLPLKERKQEIEEGLNYSTEYRGALTYCSCICVTQCAYVMLLQCDSRFDSRDRVKRCVCTSRCNGCPLGHCAGVAST